nr:putative DNA-binding domain-containing protein [Pseudomaricurvus alcaniphilus]
MANHLRDPRRHEPPANLEDRRLQIYRDLVFNNIEGFLSSGFPVLRSLYDEASWQQLVRDFIASHRAHSPYFLQISEEFLAWLQEKRQLRETDPAFMLELAHYEWVELALDVSEESLPVSGDERLCTDLLAQHPRVSPLAWLLSYQYPVHKLGPDYQPQEPPPEPTFIIVYRNRQDRVQFMVTNAVTVRLLNLLAADTELSGRAALQLLAEEIQHPDPEQLLAMGHNLLQQLQASDILF